MGRRFSIRLFAALLLTFAIAAFGLCACGGEDASETDEISVSSYYVQDPDGQTISTVEEGEPETEDENVIRFVDVDGNRYRVELNTDAKMHAFDWNNLSGEGLGLRYEDDNYTSRVGIDVSFYQGDIDWEKVKASGVEFVFIRVGYRGYTEGKIKTDEKFSEYLQGAKDSGLDVGVYFYSQAISKKEAKKEAKFVLKKLAGTELELPIVYDAETGGEGARTEGLSSTQLTDNALKFCKVIEKNGYESMVYSNMIWEGLKYEMDRLVDTRIWYADYEQRPQTPYDMSFWQYSNTGSVDGIDTEVDLNLQFIAKS